MDAKPQFGMHVEELAGYVGWRGKTYMVTAEKLDDDASRYRVYERLDLDRPGDEVFPGPGSELFQRLLGIARQTNRDRVIAQVCDGSQLYEADMRWSVEDGSYSGAMTPLSMREAQVFQVG